MAPKAMCGEEISVGDTEISSNLNTGSFYPLPSPYFQARRKQMGAIEGDRMTKGVYEYIMSFHNELLCEQV